MWVKQCQKPSPVYHHIFRCFCTIPKWVVTDIILPTVMMFWAQKNLDFGVLSLGPPGSSSPGKAPKHPKPRDLMRMSWENWYEHPLSMEGFHPQPSQFCFGHNCPIVPKCHESGEKGRRPCRESPDSNLSSWELHGWSRLKHLVSGAQIITSFQKSCDFWPKTLRHHRAPRRVETSTGRCENIDPYPHGQRDHPPDSLVLAKLEPGFSYLFSGPGRQS